MKRIKVFFILLNLFSTFAVAQNLELFYENGGELGPIQIRDSAIFYVENGESLKKLNLEGSNNSIALVDLSAYEDLKLRYFLWSIDLDIVYLGSLHRILRSDFDGFSIFQAEELYELIYNWDMIQHFDQYILALQDFGSFNFCFDSLEPLVISQCNYPSSSDAIEHIYIEGSTYIYAESENGFNYSLKKTQLPYSSQTSTIYTLVENENEINDLLIVNNTLYYINYELNQLKSIDIASNDMVVPEIIASPDSDKIKLEYLAYDEGNNRLLITDSARGNIFTFDLNTLKIEESLQRQITIYPNPASDFLHFNLYVDSKVDVLNLEGKIIRSHYYEGGSNTLKISEFADGVYFLNIENSLERKTLRFIKK